MRANTHAQRRLGRHSLSLGIRLALATTVLSVAGVAGAQETPAPQTGEEGATTLETVSVLGSRTKPRTEASSAVPCAAW
ncbi:hypothetical protein O6268_23740, partial [Salmonella enterica subsp. enterica]